MKIIKLVVMMFLTSIFLLACNGGDTNSATTANPLQQYIDLLTYTPAQGKQLSDAGSNQQSFLTPGGIQINSVSINYYSGESCTGTATLATTLNGPSTPPAGTYTSSDASNYALCQKYSPDGCAGLYNAVHANPPTVRSMQYVYHLNDGKFNTQCLSNANNNPFGSGAFETILNYSINPPVACTSGSSCGYSQVYPAVNLDAPTLNSVVPVNGATNVAAELAISLTFSEVMDTATLTTTTIKLQKASDNSNVSLNSPSYSNGNKTVTFQPSANLAGGERYNIVINPSAIKDAAENVMCTATSQTVSNFSVISFILTGTNPVNNGILAADQTTVTMTFNRAVDISSLTATTVSVAQTGVGSNLINSCSLVNESMAACSLTTNLNTNASYIYTITTGVKSLDNIPLTAESVINFSTIYVSPQQRLASGSSYGCMLNNYGKAYCWGLNTNGALGNGTYLNESTPQVVLNGDIPVGVPLVAISAGTSWKASGTACGISAQAKAYCWGDNRYYAVGSGESLVESYNIPKAVATKATNLASAIPANAKIIAIDGGNLETCALDSNGQAYCWGNVSTVDSYPINGYLGNAAGTQKSIIPVAVEQSVSGSFKQISVGGGYACGVNSVGEAYCWGNNKNGQLGTGNLTAKKTPTKVHLGAIPSGYKINYISVSKDDTNVSGSSVLVTCSVVDNGKAYCWGNNTKGQLGIGTSTGFESEPKQVFTKIESATSAISANTVLDSISAGSTYVCARDIENISYCWGANALGQLGINSTIQQNTAQLVMVGGSSAIPSGVGLQSIIAGFDNGITTPVNQPALTCGLGTDNLFYCWGDNHAGQVGVGNWTTNYYSIPQKVLLP